MKHCVSSGRTQMITSAFSYWSLTNHSYSPIRGGRFKHDSVLHYTAAGKALPPPPPRPPAAWSEPKMTPKSSGLQCFASVQLLCTKKNGFRHCTPLVRHDTLLVKSVEHLRVEPSAQEPDCAPFVAINGFNQ